MQKHPTSHDHAPSHWASDTDIATLKSSFLLPHTYHLLLYHTYTPLARHIFPTLWDAIVLLTLASHIYMYTSNIAPGLAFCEHHNYPLWHFVPTSNPLTLPQRCKRINWSIHSAGGCSATGAVVLAVWHICALAARFWSVVNEKSARRLRGGISRRWKDILRERRDGDAGPGVGMLDWQCPPRDVDVRSRSTMRKSNRSGTQIGTQTGMEDVERRGDTVGQEEMAVGMAGRRRRRREGMSDASCSNSSHDRGMEVRSSRWEVWRSEGFFECLA
jgi:hypothetical protein